MNTFQHQLDRRILIRARPATVFEFFTNPQDWASWWGAGSTIDARPGGTLIIQHPNGVEVSGTVVEVQPPDRIVFTYGYVSGQPFPATSSRVTIRLATHPAGTQLDLTHEFLDGDARDQHVQGWRFQLSLFANAVANKANAGAARTIDGWFSAWSDPDAATREPALDQLMAGDISFQDKFSCIVGEDEVMAHLTAIHRFMPGVRLERRGEIRHCQGHVLAEWVALSSNGQERGQGTNLFMLTADGRIDSVTGFWKG